MKKDLRDFFIPKKENGYAPHSLQKVAMLGMLCLVVLSFTATNILSLVWMGSQWMVSTVLPAVIVELTNEERAEESLAQLRRNPLLDEAARMKAEHMAQNQYFAHYSPDGVSPWFWFGRAQYNFVHAGENLAIHFTDSEEVVDAWMDSPSHRENIMNGNYSEIGVGTAKGVYEGYDTVYVVQMFGTPSAPAVAEAETPREQVVLGETSEVPAQEDADDAVLAQSVTLPEDVVREPAEPTAVIVEETYVEQPQEDTSTSSPATSTEPVRVEDQVQITRMQETKYGIAIYSDHIATSTGGIPASIDPNEPVQSQDVPFYAQLVTQPHLILQILYMIIGTLVLVSLLLSIFLEIRQQQPLQVAYGIGLLVLMTGLFYAHTILTGGALIV